MRLRFVDKKHEGDDIWSFFFEPIDHLEWVAGQSIRLELPRPTYGSDERRFSIASAPHEKHIRITTRMSDSSFKQTLLKLPKGTVINSFGIEGNFVWGEEKGHRLFLAGGIGITPYRSIIADKVHAGVPLNATLVYTSSLEEPLFIKELQQWQAADKSFTCLPLHSRMIVDENGTLPKEWQQSKVYISGPERMVDELHAALLGQGIDKSQIILDRFTGYETMI